MNRKLLCLQSMVSAMCCCLFLFPLCLLGQDITKPDPTIKVVKIDLVNYRIDDFQLLPYDEMVRFIAPVSDSIVKLNKNTEYYLYAKEGRCPYAYGPQKKPKPDSNYVKIGRGYIPQSNEFGNPTEIYLYTMLSKPYDKTDSTGREQVYSFKPNMQYCLKILHVNDTAFANNSSFKRGVSINTHTAASLSDKLKLDFGISFVPSINTAFGIVSVHYYFTPINDDADLRNFNRHASQQNSGVRGRWLAARLSVFACIAPFTIVSGASPEVKSLPNLGNYGFGIGFRSPFYGYSFQKNREKARLLLQPMRIGVGLLHYGQANANPIISSSTASWSFMVSATYTFGLAALLGPLAKLFN